MVDVPSAYAGLLMGRLAEDGWKVETEHADGAEALSAALHRRGWNVVLYGGEQPGSVPARKALALVRLADPHLPFLAVSPNVRRGELSSLIRGLDDAVLVVSDPAQLSGALTKELDAARLRRRVGSAHHLLIAQQAIADHLVDGLEPGELCSRLLETLGETLGWTFAIVWRATEDSSMLRCASVWPAGDGRPEV